MIWPATTPEHWYKCFGNKVGKAGEGSDLPEGEQIWSIQEIECDEDRNGQTWVVQEVFQK